jgi:hypothetical protein
MKGQDWLAVLGIILGGAGAVIAAVAKESAAFLVGVGVVVLGIWALT